MRTWHSWRVLEQAHPTGRSKRPQRPRLILHRKYVSGSYIVHTADVRRLGTASGLVSRTGERSGALVWLPMPRGREGPLALHPQPWPAPNADVSPETNMGARPHLRRVPSVPSPSSPPPGTEMALRWPTEGRIYGAAC